MPQKGTQQNFDLGLRPLQPLYSGVCPPYTFALHSQVDLSIINGEIVIREGKLLTADLGAIVAEHNRRSEAICAHFTQAAIGA